MKRLRQAGDNPVFRLLSVSFNVRATRLNFGQVIDQLRNLVKQYSAIIGGLLFLTGSQYHRMREQSAHSVAFTVCGTRILMCNWGICADPMTLGAGHHGVDYDDIKLSHVYNVDSVTLISDARLAQPSDLKRKRA
jgi:hypothetical protein